MWQHTLTVQFVKTSSTLYLYAPTFKVQITTKTRQNTKSWKKEENFLTWKIISHKKSFMFLFKKNYGDQTAIDIANWVPEFKWFFWPKLTKIKIGKPCLESKITMSFSWDKNVFHNCTHTKKIQNSKPKKNVFHVTKQQHFLIWIKKSLSFENHHFWRTWISLWNLWAWGWLLSAWQITSCLSH